MVLAAICQAAQPWETGAARRQVTPPVFLKRKGREETLLFMNSRSRRLPKGASWYGAV
jgi:hypothetical protein